MVVEVCRDESRAHGVDKDALARGIPGIHHRDGGQRSLRRDVAEGDRSVSSKSEIAVTDPVLLDMLTIRGVADLQSSCRDALVAVMTPKTLVSKTVRTWSTSADCGTYPAKSAPGW